MVDEPILHSAADVVHPGGMRADRLFPTDAQAHFDPFVVFEHFHIEPSQGFDTHPHRGFEIVSYMLDGEMAHADSMGHESVAGPGDAMRITTGSGMTHSELPAGEGGCSGLQLWINLPREAKSVEPSYQDASPADLPVTARDGATVRTVVGDGSPIELHTPVTYEDVDIDSSWRWEVPAEWNGFLFALSGSGAVDGRAIEAGEYVLAPADESLSVETDAGVRLVAVAGRPHDEAIRHRGPFVE
ncbi:pirin family protein [Halobacteria archaeon AArc-dxtr1]|nr:pirin family protein [Halobacteria archaeon AArc-dxtr1]